MAVEDELNKLIDLRDYMASVSDELDAHKVIMAHLYSCIEGMGLSRFTAANGLKSLCQVAEVQSQIDIFADGLLAAIEPDAITGLELASGSMRTLH